MAHEFKLVQAFTLLWWHKYLYKLWLWYSTIDYDCITNKEHCAAMDDSTHCRYYMIKLFKF